MNGTHTTTLRYWPARASDTDTHYADYRPEVNDVR